MDAHGALANIDRITVCGKTKEPLLGAYLQVGDTYRQMESLGAAQALKGLYATSAPLYPVFRILSLFEDTLQAGVVLGAMSGSQPRVGFVGLQ